MITRCVTVTECHNLVLWDCLCVFRAASTVDGRPAMMACTDQGPPGIFVPACRGLGEDLFALSPPHSSTLLLSHDRRDLLQCTGQCENREGWVPSHEINSNGVSCDMKFCGRMDIYCKASQISTASELSSNVFFHGVQSCVLWCNLCNQGRLEQGGMDL